MLTGWKKLTRTERGHLSRDAKVNTNGDFKACLDMQRELVANGATLDGKGKPACWDCYLIAQKLGLDTTGLI